jgi:uncharacterized protein (TIGR02099 family)
MLSPMKKVLGLVVKIAAYAGAGLVILLAVALGLFRLLLPKLPEYQEEIKGWASDVIGMRVEFSGMDARWGLNGPELMFYDAKLLRRNGDTRVVAAKEVGVSVAFIRLVVDRTLAVDRIIVRGTSVEVRQLESGRWWIQGEPAEELLTLQTGSAGEMGSIEVIGEDVELRLLQPGDERPTYFDISRVRLRRDEVRIAVDAVVRLPDELGGEVNLSASRLTQGDHSDDAWDIVLEADDLNLYGVSERIDDEKLRFRSGRGDVDLSLVIANSAVQSATADIDFENISIVDGGEVAVSGRVEYRSDANGWLVAADRLRVTSSSGTWPESSLRLETSIDRNGQIVMLDARADFVNLADIGRFSALLDDERRQTLERLQPDGVVRDLVATVSGFDSDRLRYSVSAKFENVGIAADGKRPGLHGFSGAVRANHSGGLLEIRSENMVVDIARYLSEPLAIDDASGTVLWRRSGDSVTILSDNIAVRNADFDSQTNVQITIDEGRAPVIDLASTWSITDISSAKRFIPASLVEPKLHQWFQNALVSGEIPRGSMRLYGPLDKYPFDADEGRFLLEANVRNAALRYHDQWPATELIELDVVIENTRLYSERNRSLTYGNEIVDAKVEIADLRKPVLQIDAISTGTLESIREFAINSPIAHIFGGQLDRATVSGDASFTLELNVPIQDWHSYTFTTRLLSSGGSVQIAGFAPGITELNGAVIIDRDTISSESLGGRFLGQPVSIDLQPAPADMPQYQVIAKIEGIATDSGLVQELGLPLDGLLDGETGYQADILFPRADQDSPSPLTIRIASNLAGLAVELPEPFTKAHDDAFLIAGDIEFAEGGERIEGTGSTSRDTRWQLAFTRTDDGWDFDRGTLALGGAEITAPETRGLHIRGVVGDLRFEDWLALSRRSERQSGAAERIRSIDLTVANLRLLGQHIENQHVRVDRSARDWLVQFDGADVVGSAIVPYEFTADRAIVLEMDRLVLPGDDGATEEPGAQIDPRSLPPVSLKAAEFAIGKRFFGAVEAEFERTDEGLVSDRIIATDDTFEIVGTGRWIADENDPVGHRSYLMATLKSTDVPRTMQRLNYEPGIGGDDMTLLLDLNWSGGPRADFLESLDGEVQVRLGPGQLDEVNPGAGRVFGLMSIVALPRRLSLDFKDVFGKGFGFDKIEGTFRIVDGDTYTCNLSLEGPAADIGIIGRASLVDRDYEQSAMVNANFGNTLPIIGAVAAGPQVAAALLIFSQIFKKPLREVSQVYYAISGSWDGPSIENSDAEVFAASGELAGCIAGTE